MTTSRQWIAGARPRTLPAALAPVLVGTAVAMWDGGAVWDRALLALVVALALQVGRELRQRLQRRDPRHRRRAGRARPPRRPGPRRAVRGQARRPAVVRRGGRRGIGAGRCSAACGGCCSWAPPPSSRRGPTRAAPARTGMPGWARCSCSCSSAWSPWAAPLRSRSASSARWHGSAAWRRGAVVRDPRGQQPARHPRGHRGGQAHAGSADRRPGHAPAVRRARRSGPGRPCGDRRPGLPGPRVLAGGRGARARGRPAGDPAAA